MTTADRWTEIEQIGGRPQPCDFAFREFAPAAATACVFELQARLFADASPALTRHKTDDLEVLVRRIVEHVDAKLSPEEAKHLLKCARVRNRLLHADFSRAAGVLLSFDVELEQGNVRIIDLATGEERKVSDTKTEDGRVLGWLIEGATSEMFNRTRPLFLRGVALLNWLLAKANEEGAGT
jgi:hypothetical protein